jgi:anti-anti-sigma factor
VSARADTDLPVITVVDVTDSITSLDLEGEFDYGNATEIAELAERVLADGQDIIINLSDTTFIDSAIIHALFEAEAAARSAGRRLVIQFGNHATVERVLSITKADKKLVTAPTRRDAIDLIESDPPRGEPSQQAS